MGCALDRLVGHEPLAFESFGPVTVAFESFGAEPVAFELLGPDTVALELLGPDTVALEPLGPELHALELSDSIHSFLKRVYRWATSFVDGYRCTANRIVVW